MGYLMCKSEQTVHAFRVQETFKTGLLVCQHGVSFIQTPQVTFSFYGWDEACILQLEGQSHPRHHHQVRIDFKSVNIPHRNHLAVLLFWVCFASGHHL